ncbi:Epidermal growth factor receptor [Echinococcus granulosus]|uniref:receptor protein-tyrosine kinase n=1 Tax=Echinococcus granulosus TaxID=6210 RepID=W6UFN2_ECHGR|nr:Epidermal growth factor receptor [Echinococcus granulosus]EUB59706.1 Epidermal growth factor receptor [Echinococcus granulosus]
MLRIWTNAFILLLFSGAIFAFKLSLAPEYKDIKICRSRNIDCRNSMNPKTLLAYYKRQYSQCTHIIGNLVLCNLKRLEDGSDPDLSFLNSIREVSGYVYIGNNEVKRIPLISLRIIRGRVPYHVGNVGDGALIVTRNAKNYTHGLEVLDLRSLAGEICCAANTIKLIQEHNIIAWDNPMLCHFQYTVDCPQLFVDVKNQRRLSVSKENLISGSGCDYEEEVEIGGRRGRGGDWVEHKATITSTITSGRQTDTCNPVFGKCIRLSAVVVAVGGAAVNVIVVTAAASCTLPTVVRPLNEQIDWEYTGHRGCMGSEFASSSGATVVRSVSRLWPRDEPRPSDVKCRLDGSLEYTGGRQLNLSENRTSIAPGSIVGRMEFVSVANLSDSKYPLLVPSRLFDVQVLRGNTTCHSACSENDEKGHCWGPEKNQCQLRSKCTKESTTYCRLDNPFERIKCDDACIGGCNGSTSNCWACRSKRNGDTCVSFCPPRHHVNPTTSRQELNPDFKYELHDICVRQCPGKITCLPELTSPSFFISEPLLKMDTVCVIECDFKTTIPVNGSCVPCAKTPCANHCEQKDIFGSRFPLMTSEAAKRMSQCVFYSGAIYINKDSFKVTLKRPGLQIEDLWNLHNIREIVGYIYLDLDASSPELRNLTFLENLYKVTTEFSDGVSLDQPLVIYHSKYLEFLGLKSLRYMDMTAYLEALPSLCYTSALEKILPVRTKGVKDPATCTAIVWEKVHFVRFLQTERKRKKEVDFLYTTAFKWNHIKAPRLDRITTLLADLVRFQYHLQEGHVCHSECLPEAGCWGPGPAMCAHCCTFEADGVCVSDCSEAPGFYLPPSSAVSTLTSKFRCHTLPLSMKQVAQMQEEEVLAAIRPAVKCARCHEECAESCTAPGPDQCLGECKHFKSGDTCVKRCSKEQYAEEKQKLCQPCSSKCLASLKSKFPPDDISACSGPGDYLGLGGCAFCYFVKKDKATSKYQCLDMKCPPKHFGNATSLTYLNLKKEEFPLVSMRAANADLQECVPCHPECEVCVGPGNHVSVCRKCRNWMYRSECVNACPPDDTYVPNATATEHLSEREKQMLERRECLRCHEQCAGGCTAYGPEFCNNCRYAKIMIDVQANKFICNSTCPPELYKMENTNLCLDEEQYEKMSGAKMARARNQALIAAGIVLLFLLIFSLVLAVLCFNYKAKRSRIKEALKSTYTNIKAPDMKDAKSSREPNMGRWEMINIDDLTFDDANNPIGRGAFGEVYRGKWRVPKRVLNQFNWARNTSLDVAIKVIRSAAPTAQGGAASNLGASGLDSNVSTVASSQLGANTIDRISARSNLQDMLTEAKVMASVQHKNCLPLIGVCLTRKMQCMVSMFVEEGSLDRYLRLHKDDLNSFTLLSWAEQIADGMAYLEERGIIHR